MPDGRSDYDPSLVDAILGEAAHLLRNMGFAGEHAVLIGGIAPSLLVVDPPGPAHVGTGDLDICLSLALTEGDTREYERIETALAKAGYEPTDASFRWRRMTGLKLEVEFFCPAGPGRLAGKSFRPGLDVAPIAKHNFGGRLSALALEAGEAIGGDVQLVEREITLPDEGGRTTFAFRVSGPTAFVMAKVGALVGRDKPKDAYDIVWLIENWTGGASGLAEEISGSAIFARDDVRSSFARLFDEFATAESLGPASYVRFQRDSTMDGDDLARLARMAVGAVAELRSSLGSRM